MLRDLKMEQYSGGAAAIARHLSDFCGTISLLSMLGEKKEHEAFVLNSLPNNIKPYFIYKEASPTIIKKRYVDYISQSKSLGVYSINDSPMNVENQDQLNAYLDDLISKHDLMIISDYGHGFISRDTAKNISRQTIYTCLNAQINAANIGYHTMDKYKCVDCVIINETELRHELREKQSALQPLIKELAQKLESSYIVVTRGSDGATLYHRKMDEFFLCPAFAFKVVDKIGAGDAMLALISVSLFNDNAPDLSLLLGSLAAAQSVETIGNSVPVAKIPSLKMIQHSFK